MSLFFFFSGNQAVSAGILAGGSAMASCVFNQTVPSAGALAAGNVINVEGDNPVFTPIGVQCAGVATVAVVYAVVGSSGVLAASNGNTTGANYSPSIAAAGVLCNGTAPLAFTYLVSAGAIIAGAANTTAIYNPVIVANGVQAAGGITNAIDITGSGGMIAAGAVGNTAIFNIGLTVSGALCGAAANVGIVTTATVASVGVLMAGSAIVQGGIFLTASGGTEINGSATLSHVTSITSSGSAVMAGAADYTSAFNVVPASTGLLIGSTADTTGTSFNLTVTSAGVLASGGLSQVYNIEIISAGVLGGGSAATVGTQSYTASGGTWAFGGDIDQANINLAAGGGLLVAGLSTSSADYAPIIAASGVEVAGSTANSTMQEVMDGGIAVAGSGLGSVVFIPTVGASGCGASGTATITVLPSGNGTVGPAFNIGDVAYNIDKARRGRLERIVIKSIRPVYARRPVANKFLYQDTLNGLWNEYDLVTCSQATALAETYYQSRLDQLSTIRC